jgi:CRISPR-associated protein Cas1
MLQVLANGKDALTFIPGQHALKTIIVANQGFISTSALDWISHENLSLLIARGDMSLAVLCDAPAGRTARRELVLRRRQMECVLDPKRRLAVARAIVSGKLETLRLDPTDVDRLGRKLVKTRSLQDCLVIEAEAGALYWKRWQGHPLAFKGGGHLEAWTIFNARARAWQTGRLGEGERQFSNRFALHPMNAMVNYAGGITVALLTRACAGLGLDPVFGFLHGDKPGRLSLSWDCYELLRTKADAAVFEFAGQRTFKAADFKLVRVPKPHLRFGPEVAKGLAEHVLRRVPFEMCVATVRKVTGLF